MTYLRVSPQLLPLPGKPIQNRLYRKFISQFPCCACGQNWWIDPHHTGPRGRGQKSSDLDCVPLCRKCHDLCHEIGPAKFQVVKFLDIRKIIADLQKRAVACGIDLSADKVPKKRVGRVGGLRRRGVA